MDRLQELYERDVALQDEFIAADASSEYFGEIKGGLQKVFDGIVSTKPGGQISDTTRLFFCLAWAYAKTVLMLRHANNQRRKLEVRIEHLEQNTGRSLDYQGAWKEGKAYGKGVWCTHQGSLWFSNEANMVRPGNGSEAWTLAVKRGRDGDKARNAA